MHGLDNPALTVALAMLMGILSQGVARHARVPGIVVLLFVGVSLGPDGANLIRPGVMGEGLNTLVGFAVAVILFEGGLQLNLRRLRRQAKPIRRLVTWGAVVTAVGGAVAAVAVLHWPWHLAALFGTLVIVTGPTVVNPLLHRIRLKTRPATILEAEGIFIDAVGATIAAVTLEVVLSPSAGSVGQAAVSLIFRIGTGAVVGAVGGVALGLLMRRPKLVPTGLQNILGLAFAMAIFQISQSLAHESGITAAIVAGLVVGNAKGHALEELVEFKEQLTTLFIATLFVLLSADVRVDDVIGLGGPGVFVVLVLMFVVRPLTVFLCCYGTELERGEKLFLSWLAPRGIVAAAVASLFTLRLADENIEGGLELRALVFLVIAITVTVQGLTSGKIASVLGVRRPPRQGVVIFGANGVGLALARLLRSAGEEVWLVDANQQAAEEAERANFKVVYGNALEARTLKRARVDGSGAAVTVTANEKANFLIARKIQDTAPGIPVYVALETGTSGVTAKMVEELGAHLLFDRAKRRPRLTRALADGKAKVVRYRRELPSKGTLSLDDAPDALLPLLVERNEKPVIPFAGMPLEPGDVIAFAFTSDQAEACERYLQKASWASLSDSPGDADGTAVNEKRHDDRHES